MSEKNECVVIECAYEPAGIAVDEKSIFITDASADRVCILDKKTRVFLGDFSVPSPHEIVCTQDRLVVFSRRPWLVHIFSLTGERLNVVYLKAASYSVTLWRGMLWAGSYLTGMSLFTLGGKLARPRQTWPDVLRSMVLTSYEDMLYFYEPNQGKILCTSKEGNRMTTTTHSDLKRLGAGIVDDHYIYFSHNVTNQVSILNAHTGQRVGVLGTQPCLRVSRVSMTLGKDRKLYVADARNQRVQIWSLSDVPVQ